MALEATEQKGTRTLEAILTPSPEPEEVSEETMTEETPEAEGKETPEVETPPKEPVKPEEKPDPKFEARVQAEADKRAQSYREKREADTAYIRSLEGKLKDATKQTATNRLNKLMAAYDKEEQPADERNTFEAQLKEINAKVVEYNEKSEAVEQAADFIGTMAKKLPTKVVQNFGLDDPNPVIRARNGYELITETASVYQYNQNFLMAVEQRFPKGDEVRKELEAIIEGMADFEGNDKAKKLYLADKMKGLKATPRKTPPTPSDGSGGRDLSKLSPAEKVTEQRRREKQKLGVGGK